MALILFMFPKTEKQANTAFTGEMRAFSLRFRGNGLFGGFDVWYFVRQIPLLPVMPAVIALLIRIKEI